MRTLFLTSSPCLGGVERAVLNPENGFVDRVRQALVSRPRCLFVASSPDSPELTERFAGDMEDAFGEAGMPFASLRVLDCRTVGRAGELVSQSDFIILAGGHVPTQNAFFQSVRLRSLLSRYEGVILGISAGTMNAADTVYAQPELEGESIDPNYRRFLSGLGLTEAMLLPHYQMVRDSVLDGRRLFEDITYPDSVGRTFYALPDGSYLFDDGTGQRILGECWRIRDGEIERVSEAGGSLALCGKA